MAATRNEKIGRLELNSRSVEVTIGALVAAGRLEPVDDAFVQMARSLAAAVDLDPSNAPLWGRYQAALEYLKELDSGDEDEFAALLAEMQAAVGDSENA